MYVIIYRTRKQPFKRKIKTQLQLLAPHFFNDHLFMTVTKISIKTSSTEDKRTGIIVNLNKLNQGLTAHLVKKNQFWLLSFAFLPAIFSKQLTVFFRYQIEQRYGGYPMKIQKRTQSHICQLSRIQTISPGLPYE